MRPMATRSVSSLPADGGPSFFAGWSSSEVAVAALAVFLVFYIVASLSTRRWALDVAFLAMVAGGLAVTWPVMLLMSGAAAMIAVVVGVAHKVIAPKHAAEVEAESDVIARRAIEQLQKRESDP